jgi:hypothetical protein
VSDYTNEPNGYDDDELEDDTEPKTTPAPVADKSRPQFYKVVLTHSAHNGRTVFRSVSETRAKQWLENHYPRGSEAHLVAPDGKTFSYERERAGENGADADMWGEFDPSEWQPVEMNVPPGASEWADKEG